MNYEIASFHCPRWNELPEVPLYMDQVVQILSKHLQPFLDVKEDKVITSTMINNYVKNGIVEKPIKKRYNRTHLAYLFVVCILKQVYHMDEISKLISVQIASSPIDRAYDYFCMTLEATIHSIFFQEKMPELPNSEVDSKTLDLLLYTVQSVVYTLYVEHQVKQI